MPDEKDYLDMIEMLGRRIEHLEAEMIRHQAMTHAVMLCLRDAVKPDPKWLVEAFDFYTKNIHQKSLESIENRSPWWAATMDKRSPEELP